jgi:hypothetical protein
MANLTAKEENKLTIEIVRQMLTLATAGFGLVAALAWNSLIQSLVTNYIKVWLPEFGETITLLIYALIVTVLAVIITLQLSKLLRKLEKKDEKK